MTIKLNKNVECTIDQLYAIKTSIFKENEERRQLFEQKSKEAQEIIDNAPEEIKEPEKTDSLTQNLINEAKYQLKLKEKELKTLLDLLLKLDVSIDEIDDVIKNIDKCANVLINEINEQIKVVKALYDERISIGCRSSLSWEYERSDIIRNGANNSPTGVAIYRVVANVGKIENHYYGLKYYRKPLNIDYGYSLVKEFIGYIKSQSNELAIIGAGGTSKIQIGDKVTDDLDANVSPSFTLDVIPSVIGFGTTSVIGIHTTIGGLISIGSTILAITGVGTEETPDLADYDINLNDYAINSSGIATNSKVIGIGTTSIEVSYINSGGILTTLDAVYPSVTLDKQAFATIENEPIQFGTYSTYPSVILDNTSKITIDRETFNVVRQLEDLTQDFDYTKSSFNPVTIGIIKNKNQFGYGHTVKLINNGDPSQPKEWNIYTDEEEPKVGNDPAVYFEGTASWPIYGEGEYAKPGRNYYFYNIDPSETDLNQVGFAITNRAPGNPINPNSQTCVAYASSITAEETKLNNIKDYNIKRIEKLVTSSLALRTYRDGQELRAWGYLQAIAYNRGEIQKLKDYIDTFKNKKDLLDTYAGIGSTSVGIGTTAINEQNQVINIYIECPDVENL